MAQVIVRINGRGYPVACEDGQEPHLERLAAYIDQRVADLIKDIGQVGDARLLVMAALLIADELADAYDELQELRRPGTAQDGDATAARIAAAEEKAAAGLETLAARVAALASRIEERRASN
jgi:cell division protein ZapA